jgi:hypothetical protein
MLDAIRYTNSAACLVVMIYMLYVAFKMPATGMWGRRICVIMLTIALGFQVVSPWEPFWVPQTTWHGALLHTMLALCLIVWRKEAVVFVRCKFTYPPADQVPLRRATDYSAIDQSLNGTPS